jgi:uncharacterized membrane protein YcaP (DUF421 family)
MSYLDILMELIIGYFALFITVKFLGRTQMSQITPFDFISALVLGDLVGNAVFDEKTSVLKILFAIGIWGTLIFITELTTQKSQRLRHLFEGSPSIIIKQGKIDWNEMKRNYLDINQLQQLLRSKDIFSLQDVDYAIYENNGELNVLRKSEIDYPTCQDLKIKGEKKTIPLTIISDGKVLLRNLQNAGLNEDWLHKELEARGVKQPKEICYAEWQPGKTLYIQKYDNETYHINKRF